MKTTMGLILMLLALTAHADARLAGAARTQIGVTVRYDPAYVKLTYPGGDVPAETGVCADVVVRALRQIEVDLQQTVHEDMAANFSAYPKNWGLKKPDRNIDHRRVPNLMTFFSRHQKSLPLDRDFKSGDIVAWRLSGGLYHIGIVSDKRSGSTPLVIHNIGAGAKEEDVLNEWKIIGHYRW
jgi:uncharacterized protein YijF (DUF1287 family)